MINSSSRCSDKELRQTYVSWAMTNGHKLGKRADTLKPVEDTLRSRSVFRKKLILTKDGKSKRGFSGVCPKESNGTNNVAELVCPI